MKGFIRVPRKLFDHPIWRSDKEFSERDALIDLFQRAAFKPTEQYVGNKVVRLNPGELIGSYRFLAEAWNWKKGKVERYLKKLKNGTLIRTHNYNGVTVITVCDYDSSKFRPNLSEIKTGQQTGQSIFENGTVDGTETETPIHEISLYGIKPYAGPEEKTGHKTGRKPRQGQDTPRTVARQERDKIEEGNKGIKKEGEEERESGIPLHALAAKKVIVSLEKNKDQLEYMKNAARFSGDWRAIIIDLYRRKSDAPQILSAAIRNPSTHYGWIEKDMQNSKHKKNGSPPKKATFDKAARIKQKYGTEST